MKLPPVIRHALRVEALRDVTAEELALALLHARLFGRDVLGADDAVAEVRGVLMDAVVEVDSLVCEADRGGAS